METSVRALGKERPDTLTSMANLAFTWKGQGRDADTINLIQMCVELRTSVFGVTYPHTCLSSEVGGCIARQLMVNRALVDHFELKAVKAHQEKIALERAWKLQKRTRERLGS
jgi:gamma-glutamyl-gamma-aminobutyrate hydrolase PuuD